MRQWRWAFIYTCVMLDYFRLLAMFQYWNTFWKWPVDDIFLIIVENALNIVLLYDSDEIKTGYYKKKLAMNGIRQLWVYNTGVHLVSHQQEGSFFNVWILDEGGRRVDQVARSLLAVVQASQVSGGTFVAWRNSCRGQNKNYLILCFWQYLIANKMFSCIHHKFPELGHSFLVVTGTLAILKHQWDIERIYKYSFVVNSTTKPRPVLTRMEDKFCDIKISQPKSAWRKLRLI